MISLNSFCNFISINSFLLLISMFQYYCISTSIYLVFFAFIIRNYILMYAINYGLRNKKYVNNLKLPIEEYHGEFHYNIIYFTVIESITYIFIDKYIINKTVFNIYQIICFIPISFLYEIIFDFFHYWTHKFLHINNFYYVHFHKKHHKFLHPISILTFYQNPVDLLITNSIPNILTLLIVRNISLPILNIILVYKMFTEITGHSGKLTFPNTSFPQCIWYPQICNIHLYAEDHDLHHSHLFCNYSKRFSIWDKFFGTYLSHYD